MADQTGRLAGMFEDALNYAKGQLFGLKGFIPSPRYTTRIPGDYDPDVEYYIKGVTKTDDDENPTGYINESSLYPRRTDLPEFNIRGYQRKNRPFLPDRETFTDYLRRTTVSDIPESLLVRDDNGNIISVIGMEEPDESYAFPDRRGAEFFAP